MKNKKIRKKLYIKIEKRQRSQKGRKTGVRSNICPIQKRHTIRARNGRIVFIFFVLLYDARAYNGKTAFCGFLRAICALFLCAVYCITVEKYALKTARDRHDNMFANLHSTRPLHVVFWCNSILLFAAKYTLNV